ncbi:hypothetical protein P7C70_g6910, partial [Phenoliferia sp. Uapishka_3]
MESAPIASPPLPGANVTIGDAATCFPTPSPTQHPPSNPIPNAQAPASTAYSDSLLNAVAAIEIPGKRPRGNDETSKSGSRAFVVTSLLTQLPLTANSTAPPPSKKRDEPNKCRKHPIAKDTFVNRVDCGTCKELKKVNAAAGRRPKTKTAPAGVAPPTPTSIAGTLPVDGLPPADTSLPQQLVAQQPNLLECTSALSRTRRVVLTSDVPSAVSSASPPSLPSTNPSPAHSQPSPAAPLPSIPAIPTSLPDVPSLNFDFWANYNFNPEAVTDHPTLHPVTDSAQSTSTITSTSTLSVLPTPLTFS